MDFEFKKDSLSKKEYSEECEDGLSESFENYFNNLSSFLKFDSPEKWFPESIIQCSKRGKLLSVSEVDELSLKSPNIIGNYNNDTLDHKESSITEEWMIAKENIDVNKYARNKEYEKHPSFSKIISSKKNKFYSPRPTKPQQFENLTNMPSSELSSSLCTPIAVRRRRRPTCEEFIKHLQVVRETCEESMAMKRIASCDGDDGEDNNYDKVAEYQEFEEWHEVLKEPNEMFEMGDSGSDNHKFEQQTHTTGDDKSSSDRSQRDSGYNHDISSSFKLDEASVNRFESGYMSANKTSQSPFKSGHLSSTLLGQLSGIIKCEGVVAEDTMNQIDTEKISAMGSITQYNTPNTTNNNGYNTTITTYNTNNITNPQDNTVHSTAPEATNPITSSHIPSISTTIHTSTEDNTSTTTPSTTFTEATPTFKLPPEERLRRRSERVVQELMATEDTYLKHLHLITTLFLEPLQQNYLLPPSITSQIFSNLSNIIAVNRELHKHLKHSSVGTSFLQMAPFLKLYSAYAQNHERALAILLEWDLKSEAFSSFRRAQEGRQEMCGLKLNALLITPVQRIPRYKLLLQDLLTCTPPNHHDHSNLQQAVTQIEGVARHINNHILQQDNFARLLAIQKSFPPNDAPPLLRPGRLLLKEGGLKKVSQRGRRLQDRVFFLFTDLLMYASPRAPFDHAPPPSPVSVSGKNNFRYQHLPAYQGLNSWRIFPLHHCSVQRLFGSSEAMGALFSITCKGEGLLLLSDQGSVLEWMDAINKQITEVRANRSTLRKRSSSQQPIRMRDGVLGHWRRGKEEPQTAAKEEKMSVSGCMDGIIFGNSPRTSNQTTKHKCKTQTNDNNGDDDDNDGGDDSDSSGCIKDNEMNHVGNKEHDDIDDEEEGEDDKDEVSTDDDDEDQKLKLFKETTLLDELTDLSAATNLTLFESFLDNGNHGSTNHFNGNNKNCCNYDGNNCSNSCYRKPDESLFLTSTTTTFKNTATTPTTPIKPTNTATTHPTPTKKTSTVTTPQQTPKNNTTAAITIPSSCPKHHTPRSPNHSHRKSIRKITFGTDTNCIKSHTTRKTTAQTTKNITTQMKNYTATQPQTNWQHPSKLHSTTKCLMNPKKTKTKISSSSKHPSEMETRNIKSTILNTTKLPTTTTSTIKPTTTTDEATNRIISMTPKTHSKPKPVTNTSTTTHTTSRHSRKPALKHSTGNNSRKAPLTTQSKAPTILPRHLQHNRKASTAKKPNFNESYRNCMAFLHEDEEEREDNGGENGYNNDKNNSNKDLNGDKKYDADVVDKKYEVNADSNKYDNGTENEGGARSEDGGEYDEARAQARMVLEEFFPSESAIAPCNGSFDKNNLGDNDDGIDVHNEDFWDIYNKNKRFHATTTTATSNNNNNNNNNNTFSSAKLRECGDGSRSGFSARVDGCGVVRTSTLIDNNPFVRRDKESIEKINNNNNYTSGGNKSLTKSINYQRNSVYNINNNESKMSGVGSVKQSVGSTDVVSIRKRLDIRKNLFKD